RGGGVDLCPAGRDGADGGRGALALNALLAAYPSLAERLPCERLLDGPTPLEAAPALGPGVWVKRDDLTSARCGGNKVRKLELLLADARTRGRRSVLTVGAAGS